MLSSIPYPTTVPCIQGSPSSHCTATSDPIGRKVIIMYQHLHFFGDVCLLIQNCNTLPWHFFMVFLTNILHACAYLLLWLLHDVSIAWHMLSCLQKFSNLSEIKFLPPFKTILLGSLYFGNIILLCYLHWTLPLTLQLEIAVIIYNRKIMPITDGKDVSTDKLTQTPWNFMWHCLVFWLCYLAVT